MYVFIRRERKKVHHIETWQPYWKNMQCLECIYFYLFPPLPCPFLTFPFLLESADTQTHGRQMDRTRFYVLAHMYINH